jgi:8-oxo-dGTP pyrophosphatase MutT (NUDIX family)
MAHLVPKPTIPKLRRVRAEQVSDHGVFTVHRLSYEGFARDFFVFGCPDWCNVVAVTDEGEVVLVWQYRFGTDAMSLEVPGGVIDPGEAPEAAARRELREETGYEAASFELLSVVEPNPALQGNKCWTYLARGAKQVGPTEWDAEEELETVLLDRGALAAAMDEGHVTHALVVVALEAYLRKSGPR